MSNTCPIHIILVDIIKLREWVGGARRLVCACPSEGSEVSCWAVQFQIRKMLLVIFQLQLPVIYPAC